MKIERIEIYPYGGCSKLIHDVNISIKKELLILIMGPITQILFVAGIRYLKVDIESYFYTYHYLILVFNLLPIYPLDGGKLFNLILSYFKSYYDSLKVVFYCSFLLYWLLLFSTILWKKNLILLLVLFLLGITMNKEMNKADYYFHKFLMERYLYQYPFSKIKKITDIKKMRRDYYHYIIKERKILTEKEYLDIYFS